MSILSGDHPSMVIVWRALKWETGSGLLWVLRRDSSPEFRRYLQLASPSYVLFLLREGLKAADRPACQ